MFGIDTTKVNFIRKLYPEGTRIKLIHMNDPFSPVPEGTLGTVDFVDDIGQIQVKWDNGSCLAAIYGEDSFVKVSK